MTYEETTNVLFDKIFNLSHKEIFKQSKKQ